MKEKRFCKAHLGVSADHRLVLSTAPPERGLRPAVAVLYMGAPTMAQDQESSVVHGMPGEAIRLGAASWTLAPDDIAATLVRLTTKRATR